MALIVEDGTGKPDANSYIPVEYANDYFLLRSGSANSQLWSDLTEDAKAAALVQGTDYIDARWGPYLSSKPTTTTQALAFPRKAWDGVPSAVRKACCEYAVRASQGELAPDIVSDESGFQIAGKKEKVGPLEEQTTYATKGEGATQSLWKSYPFADSLMIPFLGGGGSKVIRNG